MVLISAHNVNILLMKNAYRKNYWSRNRLEKILINGKNSMNVRIKSMKKKENSLKSKVKWEEYYINNRS